MYHFIFCLPFIKRANVCRIRRIHVRKILLGIMLLMICAAVIVVIQNHNQNMLKTIENIENIEKLKYTLSCKHPYLPVYSPEMMQFVKEVPPINCSAAGIDWVVCENSECRIQEQAKARFGNIKCSFTDIMRKDDFTVNEGKTTNSDSYYKLEQSDVVRVFCKSEDDRSWSSTLTGIRMDKDIWDRAGWNNVPSDSLKLNVLMFGFDSISRNTVIRKLPKSYKYLTEVLHTHVLSGYNIARDGTTAALIPILTGKTENELPDTRKRISDSHYVNVYPFIWNDYQKSGYVTGYFEDKAEIGTFTYRLKGFDEPPTDHYMRTYYIAKMNKQASSLKFCTNSIPSHKFFINQVKNFFSVYKDKPKFLFAFHNELSHDSYNDIGAADSDLLEFFEDLNHSGTLDNTLFIFMADHGPRFGPIRNTIQGKQEERLPFFSFRFPPWFKKQHPEAHANFVNNVNKLTTPFDIYSTLRDVLQLRDTGEANLNVRSVSLFTKISAKRSCSHAYLEPHWCACLEWYNIPTSHPIVPRLGDTLVNFLNDYTNTHRNLCAVLSLWKIIWVMKMQPDEKLVTFDKRADLDGFVADLSSKMVLKTDTYQLKVHLVPGNSLFEASITHVLDEDHLQLKLSDISRINKYGKHARCVESNLHHLRKYCYCVD